MYRVVGVPEEVLHDVQRLPVGRQEAGRAQQVPGLRLGQTFTQGEAAHLRELRLPRPPIDPRQARRQTASSAVGSMADGMGERNY